MAGSSPLHILTLALLALPPFFLATYFFAQFPNPPEIPYAHPSLASLPKDHKSWQIYDEDFYANGSYVLLPYGRVRFWILGPESGQKVILINGLSIPAIIWKDVAPALVSNGFNVLLYDLYGRGYSDAPLTTYDAALYATQLALLMQHIQWDKAAIAGVSMGGGIAAAFSAYFPDLVDDKVALVASAGLVEAEDMSRTARFMSSPLVQTVTSSIPFRYTIQQLTRNATFADPIIELVSIQSAHLPGYNAALASSLRDGPIRGLSSAYKQLGASEHPVLLIWGTADNTVPYKYAARVQSLVPQAELITIEDGGHDLTISHPDTITSEFVRFFGSASS
ncbi:alpha/beta-hydrolase [Stereum hirsutum FP-91666 SS1]|uniref:alpha/beta-hydrolase n=1 Tax=Stereum hirsutum (strain FP-91666) TaxID=721885 RepID=UPI000440F2AF|nr:alpha/beta-hydrolase [Stereum hirsutum FP-91666 SS1]EIM88616.1 alpha/beta-hydrolase [Stereum hirsutum FP-91666 SS1]